MDNTESLGEFAPKKANGHAIDCMCEDCIGSAGAENPLKLAEPENVAA